MLKSFKDYMKYEDYMMNEGKFEDTPYTGKLLLALKKSFEKYYKTAKGKINFLAANPSYIFDTLNISLRLDTVRYCYPNQASI